MNTGAGLRERIRLVVTNHISMDTIYPEFYDDDDTEHNIEHKTFMVNFVIDEYVNKKCSYIAKQITIKLQKRFHRNRLRKIGHNQHQ